MRRFDRYTLVGRMVVTAVVISTIFCTYAQEPAKFLTEDELPNSLTLLPPPPTEGTANFARDMEQYVIGRALRPTPRGEKAIKDANLSEGWFDEAFSEPFGIRISKETTPEIFTLLSMVREDSSNGTDRAKKHYMRVRPFMKVKEPTSTPDDEKYLIPNGSYPSGHTSIGWATALVLAEINPANQDEILKRGYDYGQSRTIVGAHWQSDVDAGRVIASAVVARLHADDNFMKQLAKAKKEFKAASKIDSKANRK